MKKVEIYTDGACSGNPGPGGWGALLRYRSGDKVYEKELSGGDSSTTNNRMELTAFIEAVGLLKEPCEIRFCSDSQYVINGPGPGGPGAGKRRTNPLPRTLICGPGRWNWPKNTPSPTSGSRAMRATRRTSAATVWPWRRAKHMAGGRAEHERYHFARQRV